VGEGGGGEGEAGIAATFYAQQEFVYIRARLGAACAGGRPGLLRQYAGAARKDVRGSCKPYQVELASFKPRLLHQFTHGSSGRGYDRDAEVKVANETLHAMRQKAATWLACPTHARSSLAMA
jgi:hypothetical protein